MRKIAFIVTDSGNINAVIKGKAYSIPFDHANYEKVKAALIADDETDFAAQADVTVAINNFTSTATEENVGEVIVKDGQIYWKGEVVNSVLSRHILMLMQQGFPFDPMLKFMSNLMKNPSYRSVNELYTFLQHQNLPITEDGHFLGYKRVREDYTDCHTGKVSNKIGNVLEMPRNTVDDNWRELCSSGFHVGSIEYVRNFCTDERNHVMIVKVNPADVVAVPHAENTKLRTCKYEVVAEYDKKLLQPMPATLHDNQGQPITPQATVNSCTRNWDELDEEEDDSELEDDDWDDEEDDDFDDDDDFDFDSDIDENEVKRLADLATSKVGLTPILLAYRLNVSGLGDYPSYTEVIQEAVYEEEWNSDYIQQQINKPL